MNILITGWSGSGKSTLCRELLTRGLDAIDTDRVEGLCGWVDKETGVNYGVKSPEKLASNKYDWNWDGEILKIILKDYDSAFFCGNANNAFNFYHLFDRVFILDLPEAEQRRRMMARTEHTFGQNPETQDLVIARQRDLLQEAVRRGAIVIDSSPPVEVIANDILTRLS